MRGASEHKKAPKSFSFERRVNLGIPYEAELLTYRNFRKLLLGCLFAREVIMKHAFCVFVAAAFLAGCGTDPGERALTGGGIGAGAGAVGAVVLGANPVAGALIGGAAGAVTGAATSPSQINLNR